MDKLKKMKPETREYQDDLGALDFSPEDVEEMIKKELTAYGDSDQ